jgi:NAD+ synthase
MLVSGAWRSRKTAYTFAHHALKSDMIALSRFSLALAQINPILGDVAGNLARAQTIRREAQLQHADLVMFPELFLAGYPPEDLVLKPAFIDACRAALDTLARETAEAGPAMLIGLPWREGDKLHNAYALLDQGKILGVRFKVDLPNYGVFDEKRVFDPGPMPGPLNWRGVRLGLPICEDIWRPDVVECLSETGAEMLLVPNGSPYWRDKQLERMNIAAARVAEFGLPLIYLNQVGGQDELVFDGASFGLQADCALAFQLPDFQEDLALVEVARGAAGWQFMGSKALILEGEQGDYAACVLGLRDYVEKNRFPGVVLGLSGGIDSALCAAIATDALGPERVHALMLPYRYTSEASFADAKACAEALGIRYDILPIDAAVAGLEQSLKPLFADRPRDITEENIQSRARGTILMSISNKFGAMVVTTGNKSEMSVGYATLYGDMNGGFNPIKDLYKTEVFALSTLRNRWKPAGALGPDGAVIAPNILTKAPTAELRENQKDQDSLPPYDVLDAILQGLVEQELRVEALVAQGHDRDLVRRIEHLLCLAEYKRRQSAPGVKVTRRNFGRDRRYPITNRFRDRLDAPYTPDPALAPEKTAFISDGFDG